MAIHFRSTAQQPFARGEEFGARFKPQIRATLAAYESLFATLSGAKPDLMALGAEALASINARVPRLGEEMAGIAAGAELAPALIGALNARTEILARLDAPLRGECSAIVHTEPSGAAPIALQNWDWYDGFADKWLIWEIPHADGSMTTTFTEFGIIGKMGINSHGVGTLFTFLAHKSDGGAIALPVHVAARQVLDEGTDINRAMQILAAAEVSASSSITLVSTEAGCRTAVSVELYPGGVGFAFPDDAGLLVRTNHFLLDENRAGDRGIRAFPDTLLRHHLLQRRLSRLRQPETADVLAAMRCGVGGAGAVFTQPDPALEGEPQFVTLATIQLDFERCGIAVVDSACRAAA